MKWLWALVFVAISVLISSNSAAALIEPVEEASNISTLVSNDGIADASLTASGLLTFNFEVPQAEHETIVSYRQIDAPAGDWLPLATTVLNKFQRQNLSLIHI